jgi:hypothetical protein
MDLPGVDRVLVVASCSREFSDYFWGYSSEGMLHFNNAHEVQFGKTKYTYASDYSHLRGYNPVRTRSMILDRYLLAHPDMVQLATMRYQPAIIPEPRQAPEPVWVSTDEAVRPDPANEAVRVIEDRRRERLSSILSEPGRYSGPQPGQPTIGNPACRFNARSRFLRCAVRPEAGTCDGCSDFELRGECDEL